MEKPAVVKKNMPQKNMPERFQNEIALATARADARREGASAIYLRG
jgi:hypothetical protein